MELRAALAALDDDALDGLAARFGVVLDDKKRLGRAEQLARGLAHLPQKLRMERMPDELLESVRLLSSAPRGLARSSLPRGVLAHVGQGLVYAEPGASGRLFIPDAYRLQLPASPSDSPRAARLLLPGLPDDPRRELAHHHHKRVPPWPWPLLLEPVLAHLEDPGWVRDELAALSEADARFLHAVDALGGEVTAEEVLELSREPVRISHGSAVQVPRRSPVYALARRGLLLARHEGWVVPDEVERVIGRERRARAGRERQRLLMARHEHDLEPARGQLGRPPGAAAVALVAALASLDELPSRGRAASRSAVRRAAQLLHIEADHAELLACLARADGLLFASTTVRSVGERLIAVYRRGGAWDEAAREPDMFRPGHPATARATALVRDALCDALLVLPAREFARVADVEAVACSDRRALSAQRALSVAGRAGQLVHDQVLGVVRALWRSLRLLGVIDEGMVEAGEVVRLSSFARASFEGSPRELGPAVEAPAPDVEAGAPHVYTFGASSDVAAVVEAAHAADVFFDGERVGLVFSEARIARAAERDPGLAGLRAALGALFGEVPASLVALMEAGLTRLPLCGYTEASGFVAIDDPELLRAVYDDPHGRALWAASPLRDGLLVRVGVSPSQLEAALARHGVRFHARTR
jgi:hypothetical protein